MNISQPADLRNPYGGLTPVIATKANSGGTYAGDVASNGTDISGTFKTKYTCITGAANIQAWFGNRSNETLNANDITIRASLETAGGLFYPMFFNGKRTAVIEPGALIPCDPIGMVLTRGDVFYIRVYVIVNAAEVILVNTIGQVAGEGHNFGAAGTDLTDGGAIADGTVVNFAPFMITGNITGIVPVVGIIGDSNTRGTSVAVAPNIDNGYFVKAFGDNYGEDIACIQMAKPGESLQTFVAETTRKYRSQFLRRCTHVVSGYGGADIILNSRSLVQFQADLQTLVTLCTGLGIKVFQSTILPYTTSSDSWATVENQTHHANEAVRVATNTWIRTVPIGLAGIFDIADVAESARDSGFWKVGYTTDGIHMADGATNDLLAAVVPQSYFNV